MSYRNEWFGDGDRTSFKETVLLLPLFMGAVVVFGLAFNFLVGLVGRLLCMLPGACGPP